MAEVIAGRYTLIRKLASGGMAEVFLARQGGLEGFEKLVVVKRILPAFAQNEEFRKMFLDEARLAADLRHPNAVNIFDVGSDAGTYFIAMEYLHGQDLSGLFHKHRERGEQLPLEHALQVVMDAASGLHHAHTKTSLDGEPLHLVHRDVSPQNLFLTYDGVTKVLDFGIARARKRGVKSDAGVVKGKFAYLAPEALEGMELDARADQFALGIVLYELTTLSRLFQRPSDAEVLRAVMECRIPRPTERVPGYPAALEDIVLRALSRERAHRFTDCDELRGELEGFLEKHGRPHSQRRLATWLKGLFPEHAKAPPGAMVDAAAPSEEDAAAQRRADEPTRAAGRGAAARKRTTSGETRAVRKNVEPPKPTLPELDEFLDAVQKFLEPSPETRKTNVVPRPEPFVGREADLAAIRAAFDAGARIVTVSGFGGMGKTRLAQRYLELERDAWADQGGTWFVDLTEARNADDICKAVERALQVGALHAGSGRDTVTQTGRTLGGLGPALVALDNFEQVVELAGETVGEWLGFARDVRFLVTTREPLKVQGEHVHTLSPLAPESDGVKLFLSRAEHAGAKVPRAKAELDAVAEISRRLDGHPLALELAAARLVTMAPTQILERLGERFELLGGKGARGRHAALWNVIDWSWQLLDPAERSAFEALSVFRGGFTVEAALAVCPCTAELLEALHAKSLLKPLVVPEAPKQLRLGMLESIAAFAAEKLEASGRLAEVRARHAKYYLDRGDTWAEEAHGHKAGEAMAQLTAERENLGEVFERALTQLPPTPESATRTLRALHALDALLARKGPFNSHLSLLDSALQVAKGVKLNPAYYARALQQRGNVKRNRGQLGSAVEDLGEAVQTVRAAGDEPLEGRILCDLGVACFVTGDLGRAEEALESALAITRRVRDLAFEVRAISYLAILELAKRRIAEALARCDEALPLTRKRGDAVSEARVLGTIGGVYFEDGKPELAEAFYAEAQARCENVGEQRLRAYFQGRQGLSRLEQGAIEPARRSLEAAANTLSEVGDLRHEGLVLSYLGTLEAREGRQDAAAVSFSAAQSRLDSVRDPLLLTAQALRKMEAEVRLRAASPTEGRALLDEVRAARGNRPARVHQSEEIRLAARGLEAACS
ncbi:MAG: protein kinase [Myxococcaceae bacterium]|nr:protein kinase [Myxococcaceae bacterium]